MHKVLVPFPCSFDGMIVTNLEVGDERDFGSMTVGLIAAGFIEPVKKRANKAASELGDQKASPSAETNPE